LDYTRILCRPATWKLVFVVFLSISSFARDHVAAGSAQVVQLSSKRQLFLDSYLIEEMHGLHKTVHQPTKYAGNPVLRADRPWEKAVRMNGAPSVLYDPQTRQFKMWYFAYFIKPEPPWETPETYYPAYATSRDGIRWEKPVLDLMQFEGTRHNNLIPWASQIDRKSTRLNSSHRL